MRTTLTLDPDVVRLLEAAAHRSHKSFKELVNDALRRGLSPAATRPPRKRYRVKAHAARLVAGLDRGRMNALADALEDVAILDKQARRRS